MANKPQVKLNFKKGYGENIKRIREQNGLTQNELAAQFGYTDKALSLIENEQRTPTIEQLNLYSEKFNVSIDYLTGRAATPYPDLQLISDCTGLTEDSIEALKGLPDLDFNDPARIDILNRIITHRHFKRLLDSIFRYHAAAHNNAGVNIKVATSIGEYEYTGESAADLLLTNAGDIFKDIIKTGFGGADNEHN